MIAKSLKHLLIVLLAGIVSFAIANAAQAPQEGGTLPDFELKVPDNAQERDYLGLAGKSRFTISQIKADVVIIEIFSMYCPHCQREAPTMNDFYNRIQASDELKDRVKLIGIGVGNSAYEVDFFRKQYKVPFPLFEDGEFAIHQLLGEVRTPFFIGVRLKPDGSHRVFYSKLGGSKDAGRLLEEMVQRSGLAAP